MPRDKIESHERIVNAARAEFLEFGFQGASMRSIGNRAGLTCAALYRHYKDKEDMFDDLVSPAIRAIKSWYANHKEENYKKINLGVKEEKLFDSNAIDFVRNEIYKNETEFKLLLNSAKGSKYENFIHIVINICQEDFQEALRYMKEKGLKVKLISNEEMHIIMSAYIVALFEPIIHNYPKDKIEQYLNTIEDFFMPGWKNLMGF